MLLWKDIGLFVWGHFFLAMAGAVGGVVILGTWVVRGTREVSLSETVDFLIAAMLFMYGMCMSMSLGIGRAIIEILPAEWLEPGQPATDGKPLENS